MGFDYKAVRVVGLFHLPGLSDFFHIALAHFQNRRGVGQGFIRGRLHPDTAGGVEHAIQDNQTRAAGGVRACYNRRQFADFGLLAIGLHLHHTGCVAHFGRDNFARIGVHCTDLVDTTNTRIDDPQTITGDENPLGTVEASSHDHTCSGGAILSHNRAYQPSHRQNHHQRQDDQPAIPIRRTIHLHFFSSSKKAKHDCTRQKLTL